MKKEMSSFDVRSVVTELSVLEGAHMDKIFHWGAGNVLFRLNIQGEGKKELFFKDKKWLYSPDVKPETPTMPTSFASFLRKYIDNARVGKVVQVGFDRVVDMELFKADGTYHLIFEMFGGGHHPELSHPEDLEGPCHTSRRAVHPSEVQVRPHCLHRGRFHRIVPLIRCGLRQDTRHIGEPRRTVRRGDLQTHRNRQEHTGIRCGR